MLAPAGTAEVAVAGRPFGPCPMHRSSQVTVGSDEGMNDGTTESDGTDDGMELDDGFTDNDGIAEGLVLVDGSNDGISERTQSWHQEADPGKTGSD